MACKTAKVTKEKKCCYMERVCNEECAAYCTSENVKNIGIQFGMSDLICFRLLTDATHLISTLKDMEDEDWDEDEDFDEDEDDDEDEEIT